jgi:hypothetical protein
MHVTNIIKFDYLLLPSKQPYRNQGKNYCKKRAEATYVLYPGNIAAM